MSWYALEKLADAAAVVENGGASVRARLFRAFHHLHRVRPEDMPDGDLRRLAFLHEQKPDPAH
jgi:hypothetical protein